MFKLWAKVGSIHIVIATATALATILIAKTLGPEEFGAYSLYVAIAAVFPAISGLGIEHLLLAQLGEGNRNTEKLFGTAVRVRLISATLLMIGYALYLFLWWPENISIKLTFGLAFLITGFANPLLLSLYRANDRHLYCWTVLAIGPLISLLGLLVCREEVSLLIIAKLTLVSASAPVVILSINQWALLKRSISLGWDARVIGAVPHFLNQLLDAASARIDIVGISIIVGSGAAGLYSGAQKLLGLFLLFPSLVHSISLPQMHKLHANPNGQYEFFRRLRRTLAFASSILCVGSVTLGSECVAIMLGQEYRQYEHLLTPLSFGLGCFAIGYAYHMYAEALKLVKMRIRARIVASCAHAVTLLYLHFKPDLKFAAIAYILGHITYLTYIELGVKSRFKDFVVDLIVFGLFGTVSLILTTTTLQSKYSNDFYIINFGLGVLGIVILWIIQEKFLVAKRTQVGV